MVKCVRVHWILGALATLPVVAPQVTHARTVGLAGASSYGEAVAVTQKAAEAVLARSGAESCLRGKLTKALLGLSASCEAGGLSTPLCVLADRAVVVPVWSLPFMDQTARQLLAQIAQS